MRAFADTRKSLLHFFLLCAWVCVVGSPVRGADAPAVAPGGQLMVEFSDGSRILCTPESDRLKITTDYATMDVFFSKLASVDFDKEGKGIVYVRMQNGDELKGKLVAAQVPVRTIIGKASIPMAQVRKIRSTAKGIMPDGLVLYYTFANVLGDKVTDESGTGNDGEVEGGTYVKEGRRQGGAMSFTGDRQAVTMKSTESLRIQDFTIMAWVKRSSKEKISKSSQFGQIFGFGSDGYIFGMERSGLLFLSKVDHDDVRSQCTVQDEAFHHVAVTKKGNKITFYVDGIASPGPDYNGQFEFHTAAAVGARADTLNNTFLGTLDDVMVFNHDLSPDEVQTVYESQK